METHSNSLSIETKERPVSSEETPPYFVHYPQISDAEENSLATALNQELSSVAGALISRYGNVDKDLPQTADWKYNVTRNDGEYFSLLFTGYLNYGGPYPTNELFSTTYRLSEKAVTNLTLETLFSVPADSYIPIILENMKLPSEALFDKTALENLFDPNNFYLTNDNLVIFYQEDTLGPHAIGIREFSIPLRELSDILADETIAA